MVKTKADLEQLKEEFQSNIDNLNIDILFEDMQTQIKKILTDFDYERLLKVWNIKGILIKSFTNKYLGLNNYQNKVLQNLKEDSQLREKFKKNYFEKITK